MKKPVQEETHSQIGPFLEEAILGGQDGLVNVLGLTLGVAVATNDPRIVIIAGLAATFAESIAMGAVAYTSKAATRDFYKKERKREEYEVKHTPEIEKQEIKEIFEKQGFKPKEVKDLVRIISSNKKAWVDFMMQEELGLAPMEEGRPLKAAFVVGFSSLFGSLVPIIPFLFLPVQEAIIGALLLTLSVLFAAGAIKGKLTIGPWWKTGLTMAVIGFAAALAGYAIGILLGAV